MGELKNIYEIEINEDEMHLIGDMRPLARVEVENNSYERICDNFGIQILNEYLAPTYGGDLEIKSSLKRETKADIKKAIKMFKKKEICRVDFICHDWE